ncbi:TPA: hypothetical protein N0F65_008035 [Lagenidium giganteum]|uniref:PDZ domain-containing protein n=1 Tax=Lagenidium giganteum TaxID=4803 RepID=A0AAV2YL87_9STRA|nr:TPA: hypothetical protein N0F65_008035 [Lagenidium giganteum]
MTDAAGIDEFGREHLVVEAAPGRLGISLGETAQGFVVVRGLDTLGPSDLDHLDDVERKRMQLLRQTVQVGDRLVEIEGEDVVHCSIREIIVRLGKLASKKRLLTFARYHTTHFDTKQFDVEKLVHVRAPSGPLGLAISDKLHHGAFIDGFHPLADGTMSKLAKNPKVHRGCQIVNVNHVDVASSSRETAVNVLANMKDQDKEMILYRAAPATCAQMYHTEYANSDVPLGFFLDENENFKCVVTSIPTLSLRSAMAVGDILIGVNATDVSCLSRVDAMGVLRTAAYPRTLYFYRPHSVVLPECHLIRIDSGPMGLDLDGRHPDHAVIAGFTSMADAERPIFSHIASFLPGSFIISINKLDVSQHSLREISSLLAKFKHSPKDIVVCNAPLMAILMKKRRAQTVHVPKGPLGVHFDGAQQDRCVVSGYYAVGDGQPGAIEADGRVPSGSVLCKINSLNVSCLRLAQVTELLKKLSDCPKELTFMLPRGPGKDMTTKVIDVRVSPGALGIDLKSSISSKVIVDRLNHDKTRGPTRIHDHGGVIEGSEFVAIDGFDVTSLEISEVTALLKVLAGHEKIITFSTTTAAYETMLSTQRKAALRGVLVTLSPLGIEFDSSMSQKAVISGYAKAATNTQLREEEIPVGSRLVAIDGVDVRTLPLADIARILRDLAAVPKLLVFDTTHCKNVASPLSSPREAPPAATAPVAPSPSSPLNPPSPTRSLFHRTFGTQPSAPPSSPTNPTGPPPPLDPAALANLSTKFSPPASPTQQDTKPPRMEYTINMASWSGARALHRLVIDDATKSLQIHVMSSPRTGKGAAVPLPLAEITAIDVSSKAAPPGSPTKSLFRSSAADSTAVAIHTSTKKAVEFEMRTTEERREFHTLLSSLVPGIRSRTN